MNQQNRPTPSFIDLISDLLASVEQLSSLSENSHTQTELFEEFALLIHQFSPILQDLRETYTDSVVDTSLINKALESLLTEVNRAISLTQELAYAREIEEIAHGLGRCLGLVFFASIDDISVDTKQKIRNLQRKLKNANFVQIVESRELHEIEEIEEIEEIGELEGEDEDEDEEKEVTCGVDEVGLKLKYGNEAEFKCALTKLNDLLDEKLVSNEWAVREDLVTILMNKLAANNQNYRLEIILILRSLAAENEENKEKMAKVGLLTTLIRSLSMGEEERRETVSLLLCLSEIPVVRKRIGRLQGCIVMLVALLNGDDHIAAANARLLLSALSNNTQDVLHMAEAGYFKPLVQQLKEGSDMSKILMATAVSRMELTEQTSASLGEEGAIEPLFNMFRSGKLESKLCALHALRNLSSLTENVIRLVKSGIVEALLQLLFSITSVLMTLREPASVILANIAQAEPVLVKQDVAQQMLSLLNLSGPVIQYHLLRALNSITSHSSTSKIRTKMKDSGAVQLLLPLITENKTDIRSIVLSFLYNISKTSPGDLSEQLGETYLTVIVNIIPTTSCDDERASAVGLLSNLPITDKKATEILTKARLLPTLVSLLESITVTFTPSRIKLVESVAEIIIRFTIPSDKKLQLQSAQHGLIPCLVKLLSIGSALAKSRAATSLMQLSKNTPSLSKSSSTGWFCRPPTSAHCEIHAGYCSTKTSFCLVRAGAIPPLIKILEGKERDADEAVLGALSTLVQDELWEKGSTVIAKALGVSAITRVLEEGNLKTQGKALWLLERIFRVGSVRIKYGAPTQVILIDLAQNGPPNLKPMIAKILAHLELLQMQSSYF